MDQHQSVLLGLVSSTDSATAVKLQESKFTQFNKYLARIYVVQIFSKVDLSLRTLPFITKTIPLTCDGIKSVIKKCQLRIIIVKMTYK